MNTWIDVGTIETRTDWMLFPVSLVNPVVIKLTYLTDWVQWAEHSHRNSYGIIRFSYPSDQGSVSPSQRVYPKQESEIRTLSEILYSEIVDVQVKRLRYYRNYKYLEPFNWSLKLEYEQA